MYIYKKKNLERKREREGYTRLLYVTVGYCGKVGYNRFSYVTVGYSGTIANNAVP